MVNTQPCSKDHLNDSAGKDIIGESNVYLPDKHAFPNSSKAI